MASFRRRRVLRAILVLGLALALTGSALALFVVYFLPVSLISREASKALDLEIGVGKIELGLLPYPRIVLSDVTVEDVVEAARAEIGLEIGPLFEGRIVLSDITFSGLDVRLARDSAGKISVPGLTREPADPPQESSKPAICCPAVPVIEIVRSTAILIDDAETVVGGPVSIQLDAATLHDFTPGSLGRFAAKGSLGEAGALGSFEVTGTYGPLVAGEDIAKQPLALDITTRNVESSLVTPSLPRKWLVNRASGPMNARIELKNLNRDPVEGRLEIDVDPGSVDLAGFLLEGRNEFRADLRFADDVLTLAGTARSGAVSAVNRRATQVDATFELHHRTLTFQPLEFVLHRGQVRKTGRIEFVPDDDPRFDIALQLTDMDVIEATDTDIFDTTKTNRPRLSGEAQLRGVWTRVENFYSKIGAETFGGNGRLEIRGGIILSQDLLSAMANLIPGEVLRSALRTEAAPRNQPIELEFLRGSFVIEDAVIRTDDTELRSDAYHATAAGSGTLDGRLKLDAEVSLTSNGLKRTLALARVVSEDSPNPPPDYPPITVHVSGSLDNLEYHPEIDDVRVAVTVVPLAVGTAIDAGQRIYHRTGRVIESGQDWIRSGSGEDAESETETNADPPSQ